jgi:hypothetical protein
LFRILQTFCFDKNEIKIDMLESLIVFFEINYETKPDFIQILNILGGKFPNSLKLKKCVLKILENEN